MRSPRSAAVALCAGAAWLVASTVAAPAPALPDSPSTASVATARELPRREMNDDVFTNDKGWLVFKGNVDPGWNNKQVQIYKRLCKGCDWTLVKKTPTDGSGHWRTRIYAPPSGSWFWKGMVPRSGGYGKSVTRIYRTYVV